MRARSRWSRNLLAAVLAAALLTSCENLSPTTKRVGGGTLAGAAGGAAIGAIAGNAGMGAAIGAGVGLLGGVIYDQHEKVEGEGLPAGVQRREEVGPVAG